MKIKTAELTGAALDWAVAKIEGYDCLFDDEVLGAWLVPQQGYLHDEKPLSRFSPTTDWAQGGPIIEREGGTLWSTVAAGWRYKAKYDYANDREGLTTSGPTLLIAAMRGYVASHLGDEIDVPEEYGV